MKKNSHEDRHRKGRTWVTSAAEDKFIRANCTSDCSPNKCVRVHLNINYSEETVKSGLHNGIAAKKPLLKDTDKKKRLAWAKKQAMDIRMVEIYPLVWWVQIGDFWFQPACLCETQSSWTGDLCVCGSHREAWWVWWCFAGDTVCDYFEFKAHLTSMATTAFCRETPSHLVHA